MKRMAVIFVVCVILFGIGCHTITSVQEDVPIPTMRITAVLPHEDAAYWSFIKESLINQSQLSGVSLEILIPEESYNAVEMAEHIRKATLANVDALIVPGLDDKAYVDAITTAYTKGIHIIFVDTMLSGFEDCLYVGTDNYYAGYKMGEQLLNSMDTVGQVVIITGTETETLKARISGIRAALQESNFKILDVIDNSHDAYLIKKTYDSLPTLHPEANVLLCIEGTGGLMLGGDDIQRLPQLEQIIVFDFNDDSCHGLEAGVIDALIVQDVAAMGVYAIEAASLYYETGVQSQLQIYTEVSVIDAENLEVDP